MNKRLIAVLSILIVVLSAVFTGCGERIAIENDTSTTDDGKIRLDGNFEDIPAGSQIVVDSNGQSYLVDGEGNSVVYNPLSPHVIPNVNVQTTSSTKVTVSTSKKTTTTTTTTTTAQKDGVIAALNTHRTRSGSDEEVNKALTGENIQSLSIDFGENCIELHKGTYGSTTSGCEVGLYKSGALTNDKDVTVSDIILYNGGKTVDGTSEKKTSYWNNIFNGKQSNMALSFNVTVKEDEMNSFCDALENSGFEEHNVKVDNLDGKHYKVNDPENGQRTISVVWAEEKKK